MTTEVTLKESDHAPLTHSRRPLAAVLTCEAVAELAEGDGAGEKTDGRWSLNTGAEMLTYVYGVNLDQYGWPQPIRLVVDLAKAKFEKPVIPALFAHSSWSIIGNWRGAKVDEKRITADLTIYRPKDAIEANVLPEAVRVAALIDRDHPWQASIGGYPKDGIDGYELVKAGKTVEVNGRTFSGDGDHPLFILRKPIIYEASVVLWGADANTGKLAASLLDPVAHLRSIHPNPDRPDKGTVTMSTPAPTATSASAAPSAAARMKTLLAKHTDKADHALVAQLMAEDKTDDEIRDAVHAAQLKRRDDEIAELKKSKAEEKPGVEAKPGKTQASANNPPTFQPTDDAGDAPKSINEAVKLLRADHKDTPAAKLTALAYQRWPSLKRPDVKLRDN